MLITEALSWLNSGGTLQITLATHVPFWVQIAGQGQDEVIEVIAEPRRVAARTSVGPMAQDSLTWRQWFQVFGQALGDRTAGGGGFALGALGPGGRAGD